MIPLDLSPLHIVPFRINTSNVSCRNTIKYNKNIEYIMKLVSARTYRDSFNTRDLQWILGGPWNILP